MKTNKCVGNKVTIIIPIYNGSDNIERCVEKVEKQTYKNIEIILVNDGSTDDTLKICKELESKYKNIITLDKKNGGPSSARNFGIEKASGDYIFFLDSDDYINETCIESLVNNYKKGTLTKLNYYIVNRDKVKPIIKQRVKYNNQEYINALISGEVPGFCWGNLFERKVISNQRFDENTDFLEDLLFMVEYTKKIENIIFVNDFYYYVVNDKSITSSSEKIINNIININYSLSTIEQKFIYEYKEDDLKKIISSRKVTLIESEIAKVTSFDKLCSLLESKQLNKIIFEIDNKNINLFFRLYLNCLKNRKKYMIYIYIKVRKIIKILKNKINK